MKSFYELRKKMDEDAPANAVAHGGVDMNPTGKPRKMDGRSKLSPNKMFRRAHGKKIEALLPNGVK